MPQRTIPIGGSTRRSPSLSRTASTVTTFRDAFPPGFRFDSPAAWEQTQPPGLDLILGVAAATLVLLDHWLWGVVMIQLFGIFSCVDGEIARIQDRSSRIGDFLDTLTDRVVELLLVGAIAFSLRDRVDSASALAAGFALLGGVFLLTTSSEKFRSAWQRGYPKRRLEKLFGLFCAGSDSRLLMLSIGLVVSDLTGEGSFLLWLLWALAAAACVNFLVRIGLVYRHYGSGNPPES